MFFHRCIYFESIKSRLKLIKLFNSSVIESPISYRIPYYIYIYSSKDKMWLKFIILFIYKKKEKNGYEKTLRVINVFRLFEVD